MKKRTVHVDSVNWIAIVVVVIGVLTAVRTVSHISRLLKARGRVEEVQTDLESARTRNTQLKGELAYVKSDEFVEKEAREKLGMGRDGEYILILPSAGPSPAGQSGQLVSEANLVVKTEKPNWRKWWDLYIRL